MIGTTVVFAGSASASVAGADVTLQRAGVRTLELWHGAGSDVLFGNPESNSQFRCVWTLPDAQVFRELGRPCIVGGMPVRAPMPRLRTRGDRVNVLILTSYCHIDIQHRNEFPLECFSQEMLEVAGLVSQTDAGPRAHFKWRPHPAEHLPTVARICPPHLERSVASSFEDDLAWSDIVVANQSTTVVEAVLADRVLFLHVLPVYEDGPNAMAVAPERRFLHAVDVVDRSSKCSWPSTGMALPPFWNRNVKLDVPCSARRAFQFRSRRRYELFRLDGLISAH